MIYAQVLYYTHTTKNIYIETVTTNLFMQLGAIDIGSNAVRLLVAESGQTKDGTLFLKKEKMYRVPVRLGIDAFTSGQISEASRHKLTNTMLAFKLIMETYGVEKYRACATSALRDAKNAQKIVDHVRQHAGIEIERISGDEEAALILSGQMNESKWWDKRFAHLHVDVGGGSTEITLRKGMDTLCAKSFQIGTVRLFEQKVAADEWRNMEAWLHKHVTAKLPLAIIGSGGNINSLFKRSDNHSGEPLVYEYIKQQRAALDALDIEERMVLHDMNRDRAEVIVHAIDIFLFVMKITEIKQVFVPKIGLVDGIMGKLFQDMNGGEAVQLS
jgi:exopolyphosphatase/guanosine-5'-triphosphate,3'-diphosphate pyrophosphatase